MSNDDHAAAIKPNFPSLTGCLAKRVILVSLIFLVLPLTFYTIYVYGKIYNEELKNVFDILSHTEDEQSELLSNWFDYEARVLDLVNELIENQTTMNTPFSQKEFNQLLSSSIKDSFTEAMGFAGLNHCIKGVCNAISSPLVTPEIIVKKIPKDLLLKQEKFLFVDYIPSVGNCFILVKTFKDSRNQEVTSLLFSLFTADTILKRLSQITSHYNESISLLDDHLNLLVTNNKELKSAPHNFTNEKKITGMNITHSDGVSFTIKEKRYYGALESYAPAHIWIMLDVPEITVLKVWQKFLEKFFLMLFMILIIGGIATVFVTSRIAKPLKSLLLVMKRISEGNLVVRYKPDRMGFEINHLGRQFNLMLEDLDKHMKKIESEKIKKELYIKELAIGQQAQRSILPLEVPEIADLEIGVGFLAAQEVGGDFYDLFLNKEHQLFFCVADASGKGIHACIYSLLVRSMLRSFFDAGNSLEKIITKTNELFIKDTASSGVFVTAWVGILDLRTRKILYSSCGHLPGLVYQEKSDSFLSLKTGGMALGVAEFTPEIKEYHLEDKDLLTLYTDGVIEAQTKEYTLYGEKRLQEVIRKMKSKTAQELVLAIEESIREFANGKAQHDDITLVALRPLIK